jgi:hypothetical protein
MSKSFIFKGKKYIRRVTISSGGPGIARVREQRVRRSWLRDRIFGYPRKFRK